MPGLDPRGARVLLTGASSGIGAAAALAFARAGARLHLVARRRDRLAAVTDACRALGAEAHAHVLDVRDRPALFALADALEPTGGVDVAIANAGVMSLGPLLDLTWDELSPQLDVNLNGLIHTLQAFGRGMRARGRGVLMPVSSVLAVQSLPSYGPYCASKFGVQAVADALRWELRGTGVEVVHVLPGATATELHAHMDPARVPKTTRQAVRVPPEQVAACMVRAVRRPRANVLCDTRARLLWTGRRLVPWLVDAVVGRVTRPPRKTP